MHEINIKENMYNHFCNYNQLDYNIFSKIRFNRVYSSWLKNKDKLIEVFKNNNIPVSHEKDAEVVQNDRDNVNVVYIAKMFVELYSVEKDQCIDSFISGSPNGRLDEMMDNFAKKHNGEIFHDENGSPMERAYFASKAGVDLKTYDQNMDSYVVHALEGIPSSIIDSIIRKHFVAIHNMFLEEGGYAASDFEKLDIRDLDSFMEAYEGNTPRTNEVKVMAVRALAQFLSDRKRFYDDKDLTEKIVSLGDLPENVGGELDLNIGYRLQDVAYSEKHGRKNELGFFKEIQAHAGELAKVWDAEDIDRYEAIRIHFMKRMDELDATAGSIDQDEIQDIRSRIHIVAEMPIEEIVKNAEDVKDEMQDICLSCEIIIRQSLINRLNVVDSGKAQAYTFIDPYGKETNLDCIYVDDPDQVGLSLVSFFGIGRILPDDFGPGLTEERLQKFKEAEARLKENKGEDHLCLQLFNYKRAAEVSNRYGSICYVYDRTSLTPEEILVMSDELLESNSGLYSTSFNREHGGYSRFSKSAEDIVRSTERDQIRYVGSEIDIEKGDRAVAIGLLYTPERFTKKELEAIADLAKRTHRPLIIYDVFEIQKKIAAKKNKTKDNDIDR